MRTGYLWLPGWSFDGEIFQTLRELIPDPAAEITADYTQAMDASQFYASAAASVEEVRTQLDKGVTLFAIGWSLGGMLALRLAAEGLVDGAIVISAGARFVRSERNGTASRSGWDARQLKRMRTALAVDRAGVEARFRSMVTDSGRDEAIPSPHALDSLTGSMVNFPSHWTDTALDAGLEWLMNTDLHPLLPAIKCPLLIIHSEEDSICPAEVSASLPSAVSHATRLLLEGAGHAPFLSDPVLVSSHIRRWLHDPLS